MTSTQHLEMEIDLLEKKKKAVESDLRYKEHQYNGNMLCEEGMSDNDDAILMMSSLGRDRDRLDVDLAEKRIKLYEIQGGDVLATLASPAEAKVLPSAILKTGRSRTPVQLTGKVGMVGGCCKPGYNMALLYNLLSGQAVHKTSGVLRRLTCGDPEHRLKVIIKHGKENNRWTIHQTKDTVQMVIN